jgi:hypothetical protein
MAKLTKADLDARELSRRNGEWLHELAEKAYSDLERRGKLTIARPAGPLPPQTPADLDAERERARVNADWLRELAEKAKAELDAKQPRES